MISEEIETHLEAIRNGTYQGLETLKERERELARIDFLCKAGDYADLRNLQLRHVTDVLNDPVVKQRIEAARTFILALQYR